MIFLLAHLRAREGDQSTLLEAARDMIEATRTEPGCILYDLNISATDRRSMVFVEKWENRDALTAHFATPHMKIWQKASEGWFTDVKLELIYPERVEIL